MIHILIRGIIENFRSRSDKSIKLDISTLEHDAEMLSTLSKLHQVNSQIYITTGEVTDKQKDIIDQDSKVLNEIDEKATKTPSQKLRAVIWCTYQAQIGRAANYDDFNDYYNAEMRIIIDHYKSKLD